MVGIVAQNESGCIGCGMKKTNGIEEESLLGDCNTFRPENANCLPKSFILSEINSFVYYMWSFRLGAQP